MYTLNVSGCLCSISDTPQYNMTSQQFCYRNKNMPCSVSCTAFKYDKEENTVELFCIKRKIKLIDNIDYNTNNLKHICKDLNTLKDNNYSDLDILTETYSG